MNGGRRLYAQAVFGATDILQERPTSLPSAGLAEKPAPKEPAGS